MRTRAWRERSTADGRPQWTAWRRHAVPQTAGAWPWIAFPALRELALRQRCSDEWSVAWGCDWKKKRGRAAPPVLQRCARSEALFVTGIRRTAVGVVQKEVERTASEIDKLWHLVGDVVAANRAQIRRGSCRARTCRM